MLPVASPVLALDCTLPGLSLAIQVNDKSYEFADTTPRAADALHPALQALCRQADIPLNKIAKIAVTTGPGSFTGIRLGLAVAQALKLVAPTLQIIGLPTLPLLARQFLAENPAQAIPFTVLLDAAGGMVYRQDFIPHSASLPDGVPHAAGVKEVCAQAAGPAVVESLIGLTLPHPVYLPTGLILPFALPTSHFFTTLNPAILLAGAADTTLQGPAEPTYLKPLNYRKAGE